MFLCDVFDYGDPAFSQFLLPVGWLGTFVEADGAAGMGQVISF